MLLEIEDVKEFFSFTRQAAEKIPHKKKINTYQDKFGQVRKIKTEKFGRTTHLFKLDKVVAAVVARDKSLYNFAKKRVDSALAKEKEIDGCVHDENATYSGECR